MFCKNCGKELKKEEKFCSNCGKKVEEVIPQTTEAQQSIKIPGNGMSIAGMILGILAIVWTFFELLSFSNISAGVENIIYDTSYYLNYNTMLFWFAFGYTLFSLIPALVGLPLSIAGLIKKSSGKNITGLILNSISLLVLISALISSRLQ